VLCAVSCDLCDRRKKKEGVKEFSRNVHSRAGDPGSDPQIRSQIPDPFWQRNRIDEYRIIDLI
jgi:hypothetical protein